LILAILLLVFGNSHAAAPASSAELSLLIDNIGSTAGTPLIDVAVTTSADLCYGGRFGRNSGVTLTTTEDDKPPRFHGASISKLFTAVAIMQLRDEGKLSLSDRVGEYIPAFSEHKIRLEHLLTHTSGLRDRKRANGRSTREEVDAYIDSLARQRISNPPGTTWRYADAGFNLLGRIIENVTGESFSVVLRERLLQPLGMRSSSFEISRIPEDRRVAGFNKRGRQLQHPWDMAFLPSSGLQTNAQDLAKFAQAVLRVNAGMDSQGLLRFETLQEMTAVRIATEWDGIDQGYAWQIHNSKSVPVWRHAGGEAGFESLFAVYPEMGIGIAALGNQEDWPRFQLVEHIKDTIANASTALCSP
jgi:CubicO group peptidase (beta-lactamase class C family)